MSVSKTDSFLMPVLEILDWGVLGDQLLKRWWCKLYRLMCFTGRFYFGGSIPFFVVVGVV